MEQPFWITAFLDFAAGQYESGAAHWRELTGWPLSPSRGETEELATLLPPDGDSYLKVQRLADGPSRVHLDLHVADGPAAAAAAHDAGAELVADHDYQVLRSPGGFTFCHVQHPASIPPAPSRWPDGHTSTVDQVCIDIPSNHWETEISFWQSVTGWPLTITGDEFARLTRRKGLPLQILLQRLDDADGPVRAHIDWSSTDRDAEIARHVQAGSEVAATFEGWTVMRGSGGTYCITGRRPDPQPRP